MVNSRQNFCDRYQGIVREYKKELPQKSPDGDLTVFQLPEGSFPVPPSSFPLIAKIFFFCTWHCSFTSFCNVIFGGSDSKVVYKFWYVVISRVFAMSFLKCALKFHEICNVTFAVHSFQQFHYFWNVVVSRVFCNVIFWRLRKSTAFLFSFAQVKLAAK